MKSVESQGDVNDEEVNRVKARIAECNREINESLKRVKKAVAGSEL